MGSWIDNRILEFFINEKLDSQMKIMLLKRKLDC